MFHPITLVIISCLPIKTGLEKNNHKHHKQSFKTSGIPLKVLLKMVTTFFTLSTLLDFINATSAVCDTRLQKWDYRISQTT